MRYLRNVTVLLFWAIPIVYLGVMLNDDQPPPLASEFLEQFRSPKPRSGPSTEPMQALIDQFKSDVTHAWSRQYLESNPAD